MDVFLIVPYNLYTLQASCTESYDEIIELSQTYWAMLTDIGQIKFNLFYNSGTAIKGIVNILMYFIAEKYTRVDSAFTLGMELGQIIWLLFFPAKDYLDQTLDNGGIWGQDYTWDSIIATSGEITQNYIEEVIEDVIDEITDDVTDQSEEQPTEEETASDATEESS